VGQDDAGEVVFPHPAELDLEVHQGDADGAEHAAQVVVDADGHGQDVVQLLGRGPVEGGDVLFRHHRVVQLILLVIEFDDRTGQGGALFLAQTGGQGAGDDVAAD